MKRFLTSLLASLSLTLGLLAPAISADSSRFWSIKMYDPTSSSAHTLNVEYTVLSTEPDTFDVSLYENSSQVATQHVDKTAEGKNGDSGTFTRTLTDGTYTFHITATDLADNSIKTTSNQTVTVTTSESGTKVIYQNPPAPATTTASTTPTAATAPNQVASNQGTGGQVEGANTTNGSSSNTNGSTSNGTVTAPGSSSTKKTNPGKVLGVETTKSSNAGWWWGLAALAAVVLGLLYWLRRRRQATH